MEQFDQMFTNIVCTLCGIGLMCILLCYSQTDKQDKVDLGNFEITAYCPNKCCNDQWYGITSTGINMRWFLDNHPYQIAAVDPKVIPLYSIIEIDNVSYACLDVGGKIKGRKIDILLPDHQSTIKYGRKIKKVILLKKQHLFEYNQNHTD